MNTNLSNTNVNRLPFAARFPVDVWLTGMVFLVPASYLFFHNQTRILVALMSLGTLILIWMRDRTMGIVATFSFLLVLGDIRRIMDMVAPTSAGLDLLLLIGPVFSVYLAVPLLFHLKLADTVSKAVLALMAIMFLEMFNPRQGSIVVGFSGAFVLHHSALLVLDCPFLRDRPHDFSALLPRLSTHWVS